MTADTGSATLRRRLALMFVALAVVTVAIALVAVVAATRLYSVQDEVVHTLFRGYEATNDLNQALLDQETGFRGFVLSRDENFLAPYENGRRGSAAAAVRLREVEAEFPQLRARHEEVDDAVSAWRRLAAEPGIREVRAGRILDESELQGSKDLFDDVRAAVRDYRRQLLDIRNGRTDDLYVGVRLLNGVLVAGLVLLILSAVAIRVALRRWVIAPLQQLGTAVDRVEQGDLSRQVGIDESAPSEVQVLARQVEQMRLRILHEFALAEESRVEALRARELVEEQAEDLRRSNAELEQFAYVASHDLQEPLRKVASFCQLIERRYKGQLDERGEQYIEYAVDGAKRMQQLINDLLVFSRVGRTTGDFQLVDLERVMAQSERQLAASLEEAGAVVTHDPLPEVPGDASLLVQLLQNLIANAVKFRSDEAPRVHVGVQRPSTDPDFWEFSCADNGIGIDPQYEDKIFVIFQRLHGRDAYGGTGIGLAMCKKIVEHHGGRLWLDKDRPAGSGTGSTFRWTLPVSDPGTDPTSERTADDAAARATG